MARPVLLATCAGVAVWATGCGAPSRPGDALDRETRERLRRHVERLADDEMAGRGLGEPGLDRAIEYAAAAMQEATATFRQAVPIVRYRFGPDNRAVLESGGAEHTWRHGERLLILHPGRDLADVAAATPAFAGYGISEPAAGRDDYSGLDVQGRLVFVLTGVPGDLPDALRAIYERPAAGPAAVYRNAVERGAAGVVLVPEPAALAAWSAMARGRIERSLTGTRPYADGRIPDPARPVLALDAEALGEVFAASGYDPATRQGAPRSRLLDGVKLGLQLDAVREPFESWNIIGLVPGTDPALEDQLVVVSAHIDHLGIIDGEVHNGANDDASGCAIVLEAARRLARSPAPRSVAFVLFTAEETLRAGSLHFLAEPPWPEARIVAAVNLEHLGWSEDGTFLATASPDLAPLVRRVADGPAAGRLRPTQLDPAGWNVAGNDAYSYFLGGVPLVNVENPRFPGYHSPLDDVEAVDFDLVADAAAITEALVREIAGR